MNKNSSIIQINGQTYDAASGKPFEPAHRSVDGMIPVRPVKTESTVKKIEVKGSTTDQIQRASANPLPKHKPEHAKTLMRNSVPRPDPSLKRTVKAQGEIRLANGQVKNLVATKLSVASVDQEREQRAIQISKSQQVQHFTPIGSGQSLSIPQQTPFIAETPAIATPDPVSPSANTEAKPSMNIFERALSQATAHEEPLFKPESRHKFSISGKLASSLIVITGLLLIGGYFAYQDVPNISLHVASARAGFTASLPSYRPSGFSLGKLASSQGEVDLHFLSNSDQRAFTVTEKASDWDSSTLRDSYVATKVGQNYQTVSSGGNTIYIYGQNNATWVSGGVWYDVQSDNALSTKQLIEIASSL